MDLNGILEKFNQISKSPNVDTTVANHEMVEELIKKLYDINKDIACESMEMYEGNLLYNNFITGSELSQLSMSLHNYDNTKGFKIKDFSQVIPKVQGMVQDNKPYYNANALIAGMNHVISEIGNIIFDATEGDAAKYYTMVYKIANQKLTKSKYIRTLL